MEETREARRGEAESHFSCSVSVRHLIEHIEGKLSRMRNGRLEMKR